MIRKAFGAVRELIWDLGDSIFYQPCLSPIGTPPSPRERSCFSIPGSHPSVRNAARWLMDHRIPRAIGRSAAQPGAGRMPASSSTTTGIRTDDSAAILMVLAAAEHDDSSECGAWIAAGNELGDGHQSKDAADSVPSTSTAIRPGLTPRRSPMARRPPTLPALMVPRRTSIGCTPIGSDGAVGAVGVAYIYGTSGALAGLRMIGADMGQPWIRRTAGSSAECRRRVGRKLSCRSGIRCIRGAAPFLTDRMAVIGLLAGEDEISAQLMRGGIGCSNIRAKMARGRRPITGTGFPNHFYLRYHMYSHYFPLMALGRLRRRVAGLRSC